MEEAILKIAKEWTKAYGSKPVGKKEEKNKKEKKIMEELVFIDKLKRIIKMRHDDVVAALVSGGVDNMEKYQYMLGQLRTYQYMSQEISSLLEKKEQKDGDGTVISIKPKGSPKT